MLAADAHQALSREALHEAGHAVIARLLGLNLGSVRINHSQSSGTTSVVWHHAEEPQKELRILAGARICLDAFGIDTLHDQGGMRDAEQIETLLTKILPDADEGAKVEYMAEVDAEVARLFAQANVRAAAWALAAVLARSGEIDGPEAEVVIDRHVSGGYL